MVELARIETVERKLLAELPAMVGALTLPQLGVPYESTKKDSRLPADAYEFLTVQGVVYDLYPEEQLDSLAPAEYAYKITPDPHATGLSICLDTRDAIALGYQENTTTSGRIEIIAFAAAGVCRSTGTIYVKQIQGTHSDATNPIAKHARNGIRWSETLVRAWATIGAELGLEHIEIMSQPATVPTERVRRMLDRHREAAMYLGFVPVQGGRWRQSIAKLKAP